MSVTDPFDTVRAALQYSMLRVGYQLGADDHRKEIRKGEAALASIEGG